MSRHDKVAEAIRQEVSMILHDELKDPRLGFITVTRVELTEDLRYAKIFYSVLGSEQEHKKTQAALESGLGFVRGLLAQRVKLRFAPEIAFKEDRSGEYSIRIQEILDQIRQEDESKKISRKPKKKK